MDKFRTHQEMIEAYRGEYKAIMIKLKQQLNNAPDNPVEMDWENFSITLSEAIMMTGNIIVIEGMIHDEDDN